MSLTADTQSPRPVTAAARRQAWREVPVRMWTVVTLGVAVVILAVGIRAVSQNLDDRRLLREGVRVEATIDLIGGGTRNQDRTIGRQVDLSFQLPGETERRELSRVILPASASGGSISKGDKLPILVNPKDIRTWTDRVEPAPWTVVLAVPLLLLPLAIVLAAITALVRRRILQLYANGTQRTANVVDAHRSALVPGQKVVKLGTGAGKVMSAAYPDRLGGVARGDMIDVIVNDAAKPTRAIAARAYAPLSPG
jgi:hypothetical protein